MDDGTLDDQRRDGRTNSTLRTKEQGTHLTLNEHDDDDDDDDNNYNNCKPGFQNIYKSVQQLVKHPS